MSTIPLSLYIHFPWCIRRCPYCDFNAHTLKSELPEETYINALLDDLTVQLELLPNKRPIHSFFLGGGTPSLFQPASIKRLLDTIKSMAEVRDDTEITMEANPGSLINAEQLAGYYDAGVNRLSIGIQSFEETHLKKLGRIHNPEQAHDAVIQANKAGFSRINVDIMYGLPSQTLEESIKDLSTACTLPIDHLSWYQLTLEPNTLFYYQRPILPDELSIEHMETHGRSLLEDHGFYRYEVSAYTKHSPSQHNLNYWQFGDYLGIGAGAHGKITNTNNQTITRTLIQKHPKQYLASSPNNRLNLKPINKQEYLFECMLNTLRLTDGFNSKLIAERCFMDKSRIALLLEEAVNQGWLNDDYTHIQPTPLGQRYLNDLTALFLNEEML